MIFNHVLSKIFSREIDFLNDIFYCRLVHVAQPNTISLCSQISQEASGGNYAPQPIIGNRIITTVGNSAYLTSLGSAEFLALQIAGGNLVGLVVCKRLGLTFSSNDQAILYIPFPNSANSPNGLFKPDASDLILSLTNSNGIIKIIGS